MEVVQILFYVSNWYAKLANACKQFERLFGCEVGDLVLRLEEDWFDQENRGVWDYSFILFCKE